MADVLNNTAAAAPLRVSSGTIMMLWNESVAWLLSHYLQIAIATGAAVALVALMLGARHLGEKLCRTRRHLTHWPLVIGRVISVTRFWFMVLFAARLVSGYAAPPPLVTQTIAVLFTIAAAMQGALWVRELIIALVEHRAGGNEASGLGSAIGIIRLLVTVTLFAVAVVLILDNLGVNVTGLIAGLGIGGIAIGLAAKGIFDDLFSALSIIFDRPFQRGDAIRWDKTSGTVEAIGLKTTRVRSVTGEEVVISNTNLLNKELHNMARLDRRRVEFALRLIYPTPASRLADLPALIKRVVEGHDKCQLVRAGVTGFSNPNIDVEIQFDVRSHDWNEVFRIRHEVAVALLAALEGERIEFAAPDGRPISPPVNPPPPGAAGGSGEGEPASAPGH